MGAAQEEPVPSGKAGIGRVAKLDLRLHESADREPGFPACGGDFHRRGGTIDADLSAERGVFADDLVELGLERLDAFFEGHRLGGGGQKGRGGEGREARDMAMKRGHGLLVIAPEPTGGDAWCGGAWLALRTISPRRARP